LQGIYGREKHISPFWGQRGLHMGDVKPVSHRHGLPVDLGASNYEHFCLIVYCCQYFFQFFPGAGNHNIIAPGQGFAQRFIRPAAHDHGMAQGQGLEMPEVLRNMPQQPVAQAQFPRRTQYGDQGEHVGSVDILFFHTATGALIAG